MNSITTADSSAAGRLMSSMLKKKKKRAKNVALIKMVKKYKGKRSYSKVKY